MANDCLYEMKIRGSKRDIKRVIDCLKANYDYGIGKPTNKHFFRIFDCYDEESEMVKNKDNTYTKYVWGTCAWSVHSCMMDGDGTYYKDVKERHEDIFMGTTLLEQSDHCEIEVFSEEPGMGFSEHYLFENGICLLDECIDIEYAGYDKNGKITTNIDWEEYDGDQLIMNDNRIAPEEGFKWSL